MKKTKRLLIDSKILILLQKTRIATFSQIQKFRPEINSRELKSSFFELKRKGLIANLKCSIRKIPITGPVFKSDSESLKKVGQTERTLRERWKNVADSVETIWYVRGKEPEISKIEHDLHLNEVLLNLKSSNPKLSWLNENQWTQIYGARGHALPDILVLNPEGNPAYFIDWAGSYRSTRCIQLIDYAESMSIPIELW